MRVSITLPTRDRPGFVFLCLSSLLSQTFKYWDLVIVDASETPLTEYMEFRLLFLVAQSLGHDVKVIHSRETGIGQAWQTGMESSSCEIGQRLEDDVWLAPTYLEKLYDVITTDGKIAAVAGSNPNPFYPDATEIIEKIVRESLSQEKPFFPNILYWQDGMVIPTDGQGMEFDLGQSYKVCHLHGLFMYRKSAVAEVGGFNADGSRFSHREETDLTLRLFFAGWDLLVCPDARLWHAEAPYGGARDDRELRQQIATKDEEVFQERVKAWLSQHRDMLEEVPINIPRRGTLRSIIRRRDL